MKNLLAVILLGSTVTLAQTVDIPVTNVQEVFKERIVERQVPQQVQECVYGRQQAKARGWIEKGTNTVAGSTEGLVGAIIGGAIGSKIGGGNGKKIATGLGVVIGNQVGNNVNQSKQQSREICRNVTRYHTETKTVTVFSHYNVTVHLSGTDITIRRQNKPGRTIPITVQ